MHEIDLYSYRLGAADVFCEMIRAGVKKISLAHPCDTKEERDEFIEDYQKLCDDYGVSMYLDDEPLLTDLFPVSLNKDRFNAVFYRDQEVIDEYIAIKEDKKELIRKGEYTPENRLAIAVRYGKLLSYTDEGIERLLKLNNELEEV